MWEALWDIMIVSLLLIAATAIARPVEDSRGCSFPVISKSDASSEAQLERYRGESPVLLRGFMADWPSQDWTVESFVESFGGISVKVGSESSIVLSNGQAGGATAIRDFVHKMEALRSRSEADINGSASSELFVFDTDALRSFPMDLSSIYTAPNVFQNRVDSSLPYDTLVMPVLSMGGENSGLSFHVHGDAWLGILNMGGPTSGKTWVLYPPGALSDQDSLKNLNPYTPVREKIADIRRLDGRNIVQDESEADIEYLDSTQLSNSTLKCCFQRPGDIFYVPAGWPHLTLNSGEVYALGEQRIWLAEERESFCKNVLDSNPNDYDSLKGLAIALLSKLKESKNGAGTAEGQQMMLEAKRYLRTAISVRPLYPECRLLLVEALLVGSGSDTRDALDGAEQAEDVLDTIRDTDGERSSIKGLSASYYRLGKLLANKKLIDKAIKLFEKATEVDKSNSLALAHLVLLYKQTGNAAAANSVLETMEVITPGHPLIQKMKSVIAAMAV